MADICTPLLPTELSFRVAAGLGREFAAQASAEAALGLPASVPTARPDDDRSVARSELAFVDYVALPLYGVLADVSPWLGDEALTLAGVTRAAWAARAAGGAAAAGRSSATSVRSPVGAAHK